MTDVQQWDAVRYDQQFAFVSSLASGVVDLLDPQPGERILDLGCGTGTLGEEIARRGASVLGVDASAAMVEQARQAYPEREFATVDARELAFDGEFDAVFSNAVLHWILDVVPVVRGIERALKPGGRLVAEFGGRGNVESVYGAIAQARLQGGVPLGGAFHYFPDIVGFGAVLQANGLELLSGAMIDRPTRLENGEAGLRDWIAMFCERALDGLTPETRAEVIDEAEASVRPTLYREGTWYADYRRLRVVARKPRS